MTTAKKTPSSEVTWKKEYLSKGGGETRHVWRFFGVQHVWRWLFWYQDPPTIGVFQDEPVLLGQITSLGGYL